METHIIARTAILDAQGRVLTLTRSADDDYRPDGYDLPGGRVEDGEAIMVGALREVEEETGLRLNPVNMSLVFATGDVHYHTEVEADVNFVWLGFLAALSAGDVVSLSHEHRAFDWKTIGKAITLIDSRDQKTFLSHIRDHALLPPTILQ